jgi:hypothetical protein
MLVPATLGSALERAEQRALACGALRPIETVQQTIEDGGIEFVIRRVSSLARRALEQPRGAPSAAAAVNPFLPFDPNLFVADVSATHVALLNKFNLAANHLVIATRRFVPQEILLDGEDFAALCACLAQLDGLGFYNAGAAAGASQPHKHLQMILCHSGVGARRRPLMKRSRPCVIAAGFSPRSGSHSGIRSRGSRTGCSAIPSRPPRGWRRCTLTCWRASG